MITEIQQSVSFTIVTILVFEVGLILARRTGYPALNPTFFAIVILIGLLTAGHVPYSAYMHGVAIIAMMLGPATVALGVPLARNIDAIMRDGLPIILSLVVGALTAAVAGPLVLEAFGGSQMIERAMAPKAATTPIAIAVAHEIGAPTSLAAVFAIAGGVTVAIVARPLLGWLKIDDHRAFGLATGVAGSGIGVAEAMVRNPEAGAYAALGVALTAIATALVVPALSLLHVI